MNEDGQAVELLFEQVDTEHLSVTDVLLEREIERRTDGAPGQWKRHLTVEAQSPSCSFSITVAVDTNDEVLERFMEMIQ